MSNISENIKKLKQSHFDEMDTFLAVYNDTSMFLRSNVRKGGFTLKQGQAYSADYYGYFEEGILQGVVALCWNGSLLCQVADPNILFKLIPFTQAQTLGFKMQQILGPHSHIAIILKILREDGLLTETDIKLRMQDKTYELPLDNLIIPESLNSGRIKCRLANMDDLPALIPWEQYYNYEIFRTKIEELKAEQEVSRLIKEQVIFVLAAEGQLLAKTIFNASVEDVVQIGGVWTPPPLRNLGYARAAVAGALLEAKHRGARYATLFTNNPFAARAYESLGFRHKNLYHIILFKEAIGIKI
ncbi:GNAT family N-acetyltransferase [Candidatus Odyssella thessalonicensis]|uniref:GNAT family N-acetyltransferase n=1 Tax=Candidatus Odyssella thessalonicensis TaxID=84647 RepID=UPI000225BAEE|nr:GNAT family N-acetyltransferase [Candidatus Odyssella thessalonicensis]